MPSIKVLKSDKRKVYKEIGRIYSPILKETIYFTSMGFNHLLYKRHRSPRKVSEQYLKLMCVDYLTDVVTKCRQVSQVRKIRRKFKGRWKKLVYYELIHEVKTGIKIKVIIERIGKGKLKFRSVMPYDKKSKLKNAQTGRS